MAVPRQLLHWLLVLFSMPLLAAELRELDLARDGDGWRAEFTLSQPVSAQLLTLSDPHRLVVDFPGTRLAAALPRGSGAGLRDLRSGQPRPGDLRLVFDLDAPAHVEVSPDGGANHRLQLSWRPAGGGVAGPGAAPAVVSVEAAAVERLRDVIVVIDPGHGGHDPGALGPGGTREKDIVLALSKELARRLNQVPGLRAVLTREDDRYLRLRERINLARAARADLFISLHADAFPKPQAKGASVYTLSERGASSEQARFLAARENASDLIGVELHDKHDDLAEVLFDLSQSGSLEASDDAARRVLGQLDAEVRMHKRAVQRAGFMVLKSPDVPSLLIETGFISNPGEERLLGQAGYRARLAEAISRGVQDYFQHYPPPGTRYALRAEERRHVIRRGETLSTIAARYAVPLTSLRQANQLRGDRIFVGQELRIPSQDS